MSEDAGDEFTKTAKSIGDDLWALFKTIVEERRRRERESRAQAAAEEKEKTGLERDAQIRKEEREFMKAENEKMRTEMREVLKANGMETSDKNLDLTREQGEKMMENHEKIDANNQRISDIDTSLKDIDRQQQDCLKKTPEPDLDGWKELQAKANELVVEKANLNEANTKLEAENVMLKNGKGLEQLQTDNAVKNDLAKQMEKVNAGIARDKKNIDYCNDRIPKIDKEQADLLKSPKPDMDKWEKLQAEKEGLQKERGVSQEGLAKKEGQFKDLKAGKSLEQMEKVAKLDAGIKQGKQEVEGLDNAIKGYEKKEKELLDAGKKPGDPELDSVQKKKQALSDKKQEAQKEVTKLEKELDGVNKGVEGVGKVKMEPKGPLTQSPELHVEGSIGPKVGGSPKVSPLAKGPESLGESPIGPELGGSPKVGEGTRKFRSGSVGDTLQKQGYKIGDGPKHGRSMSVGGVK